LLSVDLSRLLPQIRLFPQIETVFAATQLARHLGLCLAAVDHHFHGLAPKLLFIDNVLPFHFHRDSLFSFEFPCPSNRGSLTFYNRANARRAKGDLEGELQDYNEAIRLKPDYVLAFNNRGIARRAKGDIEGALQDYSEAIRLKPDYALAFNNRGIARTDKGDMEGALQDYNEAIRLDKSRFTKG
jgi:tetratricopeptide (TPR) repeat protein